MSARPAQMTRRDMFAMAASGACLGLPDRLRAAAADGFRIEPQGVLIRDCGIAGETRADDITPAHPNGIPVSRNRWLLAYATRGFRGVDDDLSILYQLRAGAPDGPLVKEGVFTRARANWDPLGNGKTNYVLQHGHAVAFGVPRGARIGGKPAPSANVFVVKWRKVARVYDRTRNYVEHSSFDPEIERLTQSVEWVQFRLNAAENDIEIIQPPAKLRQKGYATGARFCSAPIEHMNESFVQAVPFNRECTEWADCNHFDGGRIACLKYTFNAGTGTYEWTAIGPLLGGGKKGIGEASLARWRDTWIIAARGGAGGGVTWFRTDDPFGAAPQPVFPDQPKISAPLTAYRWGDGALRLFSGDATVSPYKNGRDPLYCWDIDPDRGFAPSGRRVIFDTFEAGLPIRAESGPKVDMCKLLPAQGKTQIIAYRVSIRAFNHPYVGSTGLVKGIPLANAAEKAACAIYYSRVTYAAAAPTGWEFAG